MSQLLKAKSENPQKDEILNGNENMLRCLNTGLLEKGSAEGN
jgi:hypothetical protein